jgi:hypothetical protein
VRHFRRDAAHQEGEVGGPGVGEEARGGCRRVRRPDRRQEEALAVLLAEQGEGAVGVPGGSAARAASRSGLSSNASGRNSMTEAYL